MSTPETPPGAQVTQAIEKARSRFGKLEKTAQGHKNKYCPLEDVVAAVEGPLKAERIVIRHQSLYQPGGWAIRTALIHLDSADTVDSYFPLAPSEDPQRVGSSMTYGKRYNLVALLNLLTETDDDGEGARARSGRGRQEAGGERASRPASEPSMAKRFYDALSQEFGDGPPWEIPGKRKLIKKLFGKFDTDLVREKLRDQAFVDEMGARWEMAIREVREELELERQEASQSGA